MCAKCGMFGHDEAECRTKQETKQQWVPKQKAPEQEWQVVTKKKDKGKGPAQPVESPQAQSMASAPGPSETIDQEGSGSPASQEIMPSGTRGKEGQKSDRIDVPALSKPSTQTLRSAKVPATGPQVAQRKHEGVRKRAELVDKGNHS